MISARYWTHWLIFAVAVITVLSGAGQLLAPEPALSFMGIDPANDTIYLFRLLSLLVALFGGALLHTALTSKFEATVLLWAALQKILSAAAMLLGVISGLLAAGVLLVAGYDFAAGLYVLWFRKWGSR